MLRLSDAVDAVDEVSEQRHRLDGFRAVGPRELVVERRREEAVAEGLDDGVPQFGQQPVLSGLGFGREAV